MHFVPNLIVPITHDTLLRQAHAMLASLFNSGLTTLEQPVASSEWYPAFPAQSSAATTVSSPPVLPQGNPGLLSCA
jgi:hypothetical protein